MRLLATAVMLLTLAAPAVPASAATVPHPEVPDARVVVSPIDTGINPYHDFFQVEVSSVTQDVLDEFGIDADHVITLGDSFEEDAAIWEGIKFGEAYHFTGTNIIAYSTESDGTPIIPDGSAHGVGVAGSIVRGNPEAIIFAIEGSGSDGESIAFNHPSVDIVTTSYGFLTAVPLFGLTDAYSGVVEQGKAHFGASPNDPSPASLDGTSGPWWGISMAGYAEGDTDQKTVMSGSAPEFVADFTQELPYCATCTDELDTASGTSFATPLAAGIASRVLLEARRAAGHIGGITAPEDGALMVDAGGIQLSTWDLRRALQAGAVYPEGDVGNVVIAIGGGMTYPTPPEGEQTIMGWGALTPDPEYDVVGRALGSLGIDGYEAPAEKDADVCDFMNAHFDARLYAWDANPTSDSFGGFDSAGYIYC